jgi:hypothetical protein
MKFEATSIFVSRATRSPSRARQEKEIHNNGNTLIASNSGFTVTDAIGINDSGQILCNAKNSSNVTRAVLLSPK